MVPTIYVLGRNMKNIRIFHLKIFIFFVIKFSVYLNRHVFVMYRYVFVMYYHIIVFIWPWLTLYSPVWGRESWLLCFSSVCNLCADCHSCYFLFGVIGKLCSVILDIISNILHTGFRTKCFILFSFKRSDTPLTTYAITKVKAQGFASI